MAERIKTLGIFALLALMMVLLYGNLTLGMDQDPWGLLGRDGTVETADPLVGEQWAVSPVLLALGRDGEYYVPLTESEWDLLRNQASPLLTEAVGSMGAPEPAEPEAAAQWLREDCLLVRYEYDILLSALRAWSDAAEFGIDPAVDQILLRQEQGRVVICFREGSSGSWYRADTAAGPQQLIALGERYARANARLAAADSGLAPDCMVLDETGPLPLYRPVLPEYADSGELPRTVLSAFGINGYLAKVYREEQTGDTIYVENYSSVRITEAGELTFTASAGQGIPLENPSDASAAGTLLVLGRRVWDLLGAGGTLTLAGVNRTEEGSRLLTYDLLIGGHPVSGDFGYALTARVDAGIITMIHMRPLVLENTGNSAETLSFRYGAMLLEGREGAGLSLCYEQRADGLLAPALRVED